MTVTPLLKHDVLATISIRFLSSLTGQLMHRKLFEGEGTLQRILCMIVIPNLTICEIDRKRFKDDPTGFIMQCPTRLIRLLHLRTSPILYQHRRRRPTLCVLPCNTPLAKYINDVLEFPNAYGLTVQHAMKASPNGSILKYFLSRGTCIDASGGSGVRRAMDYGVLAEKISLSSQELLQDFAELVKMV